MKIIECHAKNKSYCQNQYCALRPYCTDEDNSDCELYLSEPRESAWEMFRRLYTKWSGKLGYRLEDKFGLDPKDDNSAFLTLWNLILNNAEPEAIKIMKEIQEEME